MNRRIYFLGTFLLAGAFVIAHEALPQTGAHQRQVVNSPDRNPALPFSNAILEGDTLYISGSIGIDPKTGKAPDKIEGEVKLLMDGYKKLLEQAGFTLDDLAYVQIACTDLKYYDQFNQIYKTYFTRDFPAREFIGVSSILRGGHFEMQAIAVSHTARLHLAH